MEHDRRRHESADARSGRGGPEQQIALFGEPGFTTEPRAKKRGSKPLTNEERSRLFHAENPEVFEIRQRRRSCSLHEKEAPRKTARWRAPSSECSQCGGTGWKDAPGGRVGVVKCGCRARRVR